MHIRDRGLVTAVALLLAALPALAQEALPPGAKVAKLEAHPTSVALKTPFDYAQVVLTAQLESGERIDVTRAAKWDTPSCVKQSPAGLVRPTADGEGSLNATVGDKSIALPVKVTGQKEKYTVSFVQDVMPTL